FIRFSIISLRTLFLFFLLILYSPIFTLFPYTTLFRSWCASSKIDGVLNVKPSMGLSSAAGKLFVQEAGGKITNLKGDLQSKIDRSEEHTSELQSRFDIVCRLLLEKKKKEQLKSIIRIY